MKDPFNIPTILTSQELMDKAFGRASKASVRDSSAFHHRRKTTVARIGSAGDIINVTLERYIKSFPSFQQLHPFLREMTGLAVDVDQVRKSLGALQWAREQVSDICRKSASQAQRTRDRDFMDKKKSEAFGRMSSVLRQISGNLEILGKARNTMRTMATVDPELPTVVIAGAPNAGKSALVRRLSTARPEVAQYPFTTRDIHVGVFEHGRRTYQVIDTPGLLDRAPEERNDIERRAGAALRYLGGMVVFLIDPSESCGHPMQVQESLLERVQEEFSDVPFMVVETKSDLKRTDSGRLPLSGETGEGVEGLRKIIAKELKPKSGSVDKQIIRLMEEREENE